jgi:hypothetical protein
MKKFINDIFYISLGLVVAIVVMWRNAEYIVSAKQKIKEKNRERGTPVLGLYKGLRKLFIPPREAALIPERRTVYQYPRKAELQDKPGFKPEPTYDELFYDYIVIRKMTKAEAFNQALIDYPTIYSLYSEKSFTEAMRRREKKQTKT